MSVAFVPVSEAAEINPKPTRRPGPSELVAFVGMADLDSVSAVARESQLRPYGEVAKAYTSFENDDLLLAKITPCFENRKIGQAQTSTRQAAGSTEFHVIRPREGVLDARYLLHFLRQDWVLDLGELRMTGSAGQRRVPERFLDELRIPLPPVGEQQRIAAILDAAQSLCAKRRRTLAALGTLVDSVFVEVFGDVAKYESAPFGSTLAESLRNGISPAKSGTVVGKVLTLSAVTGDDFDPLAVKESTFAKAHTEDKTVRPEDFLICRGNGNLRLVGRGRRPRERMVDVAFPDTMIAARCDVDLIAQGYLDHVWNTSLVRRQLEAAARTTNGTHKINQAMIEEVVLPLPPIAAQRSFEAALVAVEAERSRCRSSAHVLDDLFASLAQRAFRGEL